MLLLLESGHSKLLICFLASVVPKHHCKQLSFVQRTISILLYGNGASKEVGGIVMIFWRVVYLLLYPCHQVFNSLQPLMICLSHQGYLKLVDRLTENYGKEGLIWCDNWRRSLQVFCCTRVVNHILEMFCFIMNLGITNSTAEFFEC